MRKLKHIRRGTLAMALVALAALAVSAAEDKKKDDNDRVPDVIYWPTPQEVVDKMLETAKVKKTDVLYDLGCGDGRIVLTAARKYKCKAKGFDIDPKRMRDCLANLKKEDKETQKRVQFERQDIFKLDLKEATVVTLYLLPELNLKLVPQLNKLKKGTRIVSHDFDMEGYKPDKELTVKLKDGTVKRIFLWTIPLQMEKVKKE